MKKTGLVFLVLIFLNRAFSQTNYIEVEYSFNVVSIEGTSATFFKILKDNGKASIYTRKDTPILGTLQVMNTTKSKSLGIYFDKVNNKLYECAPIFDRYFYIKEDSMTEKFQWAIHDTVQKEILGYRCKLATCEFRGRSYKAYYTESLPFFTGPWKLTGLPGVILEASTNDGRFKFEAYKIYTNIKSENITNPYDTEKLSFMTFVEYKKLLLKKLLDSQRKIQAEEKEDFTYKFEDSSIELLKEQ